MNTGALAPGARLPSARSLASQLGVARGTVDAAYAVLSGEGIIEARGPAGSIVSPHLAARPRPPPQRAMPLTEARSDSHSGPPRRFVWDCPPWTPSRTNHGPA